MVATFLNQITPYKRVIESTIPVTVQCLSCLSMDTLYAEVRNGKIVAWDFDRNYVVTQKGHVYHICGGICKLFFPHPLFF